MAPFPMPSPVVPVVGDDGKASVPWYQYLKTADITWRPTVSIVASSTNAIIPNKGLTVISATDPRTYTLESPTPGQSKTIMVESVATTAYIQSPSTTTEIVPGTGWALTFGSSSANKAIEMIGVTTGKWLIKSNPGLVTVTT